MAILAIRGPPDCVKRMVPTLVPTPVTLHLSRRRKDLVDSTLAVPLVASDSERRV